MANGTSQSAYVNTDALNTLVKELVVFSRAARALGDKIQALVPSVGSDAWWEKEERVVESELKKKKYTEFSSVDQAISYLQKYT